MATKPKPFFGKPVEDPEPNSYEDEENDEEQTASPQLLAVLGFDPTLEDEVGDDII